MTSKSQETVGLVQSSTSMEENSSRVVDGLNYLSRAPTLPGFWMPHNAATRVNDLDDEFHAFPSSPSQGISNSDDKSGPSATNKKEISKNDDLVINSPMSVMLSMIPISTISIVVLLSALVFIAGLLLGSSFSIGHVRVFGSLSSVTNNNSDSLISSDSAIHHIKIISVMENQSRALIDMLNGSTDVTVLSVRMRKAQLATRDLTTVVKYSSLRSRDALARALQKFSNDALAASKGLMKFKSGLGTAIDRYGLLQGRTNYTKCCPLSIIVVDELIVKAYGESGVAGVVPNDHEVTVFSSGLDHYYTIMASHLKKLIVSADSLLLLLNNLEHHLLLIHEITVQEVTSLPREYADVLGSLWTLLGGNRAQISEYGDNLRLLQQVEDYRLTAQSYVMSALYSLEKLNEELDEVRDRVAEPELSGQGVIIHLVHNIRKGVDSLMHARAAAVPQEERAIQDMLGGL